MMFVKVSYSSIVKRFAFAFVATLVAQVALASEVRVAWNPNREPDIRGYKIYIGSAAGSYSRSVDVGNDLSHLVTGLNAGARYYVAVSAYNRYGVESPLSPPVAVSVPSPDDFDGDGVKNSADSDDDNDGLPDSDEQRRGTDPSRSDSDNDGIADAQEVADGTSPRDAGSGEAPLDRRICSEWNGFLGGLWNIAELVNMSARTLRATVTLYDQTGAPVSDQIYDIGPDQQLDSLVHDFPGRDLNSYGNLCITHDGQAGDLDGRMVYYKEASARGKGKGAAGIFDFALAMPFSNGKKGRQFVFFDTFQRSAARKDRQNLVANWIQVSNLGADAADGVLRTYAANGVPIGDQALHLGARQRFDLPAHQFGPNQIGVIEWIPANDDVPFILRNTRYVYDNPGSHESFSSAFQAEGVYASGDGLVVPFETNANRGALLQVTNALSEPLNIWLNFFNGAGQNVAVPTQITINPRASYVLPLESIIPNVRGSVLLRTGVLSSLVAGVTEYTRDKKKSIVSMSYIPARSGAGNVLRGSFNTYMAQRSDVWITNSTDELQEVAFSSVPSSGSGQQSFYTFGIPSHGTRIVTVPGGEAFGVATVQTGFPNALVGWVRRERGDFVIPTPMRQ